MGRKATTITLCTKDREFLELQTPAQTIQAQTVNRARILLLMLLLIRWVCTEKVLCFVLISILQAALKTPCMMLLTADAMLRSQMMKKNGLSISHAKNRLTLAMLLKPRQGRYLLSILICTPSLPDTSGCLL